MQLPILNIKQVAESQMCLGCGACASVDPDHIAMADVLEHGRRPILKDPANSSPEALAVCPGIALAHTFDEKNPALIKELIPAWGPVLEVWEGYAADNDLRIAGSSGGAASALSCFALEKANMHGVLHIAARKDIPYLNETVMSHARDQLLARTGSRYAPASPCDSLHKIEAAPAPCVFIGKPCDVAATAKARALRPALDKNLGLTIAIFCAGTPSTKGTLEMLKQMGIEDPADVTSVRYRGNGWPGNAVAKHTTPEGERAEQMTYAHSWGTILQKHRQWRCYVCVDHTGEFADIAVGDPWYRPIPEGETGRSLLLVRTERGRQFLKDAIAAGYIVAEPVKPNLVEASQKGFPTVRGSVWGRILVSRLMGAAAPRFTHMPMFRFWLFKLSLKEKLQSIYGTWKRVRSKNLRRPVQMQPYIPAGKSPAAVDINNQSSLETSMK